MYGRAMKHPFRLMKHSSAVHPPIIIDNPACRCASIRG